MELWQQFINEVNSLNPRDEKEYQGHMASIMRLIFHWKDLLIETNIPVGNNRRLRPDIVLQKDDAPKIIIEMKDKNAPIGDSEESQLRSYLLQMKVRFGLLIGDKITLVYNDLAKIDGPIRLATIEFKSADDLGPLLADILDANNYTDENFEKFCEKCLRRLDIEKDAEELVKKLTSEAGITELSELLKTKYDPRVVDKALAQIVIEKPKPIEPVTPIKTPPIQVMTTRTFTHKNSPFRFDNRGIPVGSILTFFDNDNITATVSDYKYILFRGQATSLSAATRIVFEEQGRGNTSGAYQGPKFWKYKGTPLTNLPLV